MFKQICNERFWGNLPLCEFWWQQIQRARQRVHTSPNRHPSAPHISSACTNTPTGTITSKGSDTRLHGQLAPVEVKV